MNFNSKKEFLIYLKRLKMIGFGSQGISYYNNKNNMVYKVFHQFFDDYDEEYYVKYEKDEFLKFSKISNNTFVWPNDVIIVEGEVVGYISNYVNAKSLYKTDPLSVNLDNFVSYVSVAQDDIELISNNGIMTYDMIYNILYGKGGIYIIDTDEYIYSDMEKDKLNRINNDNFNYEIISFLVDSYFDEFISNYKILMEMYNSKDVDVKEFIMLFRKKLSEVVGKDVVNLSVAKRCLNKKKIVESEYKRDLFR